MTLRCNNWKNMGRTFENRSKW